MEDLKEIFVRSIQKYDLLKKGDKILIAVSGGPDSTCLLDLFNKIKDEWNLKLCIIHLNHMLRGDAAEKDTTFVEELARIYDLPVVVGRENVERYARERRLSIETAARECRLNLFLKEAGRLEINKVALAHHKDDQAETVLLRILRGTGIKGLGAMKASTDYQGLTLIRPLLDIERDKIMDYLRANRIKYRMDMSNYSDQFLRNRIRSSLLPELEKTYNPRIKDTLVRFSKAVASDIEYLDSESAPHYPKVLKRKDRDLLILNKPKFDKLHEAIKFRIIQLALKDFEPGSELDFFHWEKFRELLDRGKEKAQLSLARDVLISIERKELVLKRIEIKVPQYEYKLKAGESVFVNQKHIKFYCEVFDQKIYKISEEDKNCAIMDYDKLSFPLIIRNRKEGDRFKPLGLPFKKKIKDFFIDKKVPSYEKDILPLVVSGNEIVWVYGIEIADSVKVTRHTKKFLKITGAPSRGRTFYHGKQRREGGRPRYFKRRRRPS